MNFLKLSWRTYAVFIATGIFVGFLITAQFRSSVPTSAYLYDEITVRTDLIKSFSDDQASLKSKIVALRAKIEESQAKAKSSLEKASLDTLSDLKKDVGLETVKGMGVEINLNDGVFVNRENTDTIDQALVQASDLRDIVNLLRSAKSQAIAINDQRIISSTPITSLGNTILVNNVHLLPPFNIVAIGDSGLILQQITDAAALPDLNKRVKKNKLQFDIKVKNGLIVPVYNGDFSLKFIAEAPKNN